jgi:signal transduction histidine kinase
MNAPERWRVLAGSLRVRVTVGASLAVLAVLALAGIGLVTAQRSILTESLDDTLRQQAVVAVREVGAGRVVDRQDLLSDDVIVDVTRPDGSVLWAVPGPPEQLPDVWPPAGGRVLTTADMPGEGPARVLARDVEGSTVRVAGSLDDVADSVAALTVGLAVAVPLAAGVLAAVVWWAVGRALRPVEDLRVRVDAISAARQDQRVPEPPAPREIARLAHTMNAMLARLQESAERQRRFVADAAHELRTPLARMRAEIEVDRAHPGSADPAATSRSVLDETVTLQQLVDDLLLLARGDAGALDDTSDGVHRTVVDLDEVVGRLAAHARRAGADVDTHGVRPVQVTGDAGQLERAVANLLDNAVRHARSRVTVTLRGGTADAAELVVADDGPGIAAEHRERVFERFTRLDDARSAGVGGAGLGLAIARDIVQRHGGRLTLATDGRPGAWFVLALPVTQEGDGRIGRPEPG